MLRDTRARDTFGPIAIAGAVLDWIGRAGHRPVRRVQQIPARHKQQVLYRGPVINPDRVCDGGHRLRGAIV